MSSRTYLPLHLPRSSRGTVRAFVMPLRPCEPRLFLPFRVSVPLKRVGFACLLCPLLTSGVRSPFLAERSVRVVAARQFLPNTRQISQGKFGNLHRTPARIYSTGLRWMGDFAVLWQLVPPALPTIRFLCVGPRLCSTLPSDPASRRRPCASLILHLHQVG